MPWGDRWDTSSILAMSRVYMHLFKREILRHHRIIFDVQGDMAGGLDVAPEAVTKDEVLDVPNMDNSGGCSRIRVAHRTN